MSWNTFLSRTSVSTLSSAAFSESSISSPVRGLDDVLSTVKALSLQRFQYEEIERQDVVGEGETFVVERCVVRNQVLAIKHLRIDEHDRTFRRRLQSVILELRIMRHAPLRGHPNILTVFGYGWNMKASQAAPYLLVPYAPYGTLRQYLRRFKSDVPMAHKEILLGDVAAATTALHLCGIVHGDLKLDNVLVFHSWDRPAKSIAKLTDFGHSLVVSGKEDSDQSYMRYGGTFIYNAPEVHNQKDFPLDRAALQKCDVWAFGLLTWETFLDGEDYVEHVAKVEPSAVNDGSEPILTIPQKFLDLAKNSLPLSKANLRGNILRSVLNMTIQVDPAKRISDLAKLPFMSKWHSAGVQGLKAELALHFGSSEWSYEMFRSENGKEIPWEHEEMIYQGLRRTYSGSHNRNGDAAWQLALCQYIGFGDSPNPNSAHQLALAAERLNHPVAKIFAPLLAPDGPPESYVNSKTYAKRVVDLFLQSKAAAQMSHLVEACCKGDTETIFSWLKTADASDENTRDECGILHFLFALEDSTEQEKVLQSLHKERLSLEEPTKLEHTAHGQWPLRLVGSPLVFAISVGSVKTVRQLLSFGANPCARAFASDQFPEGDYRSQWTPIHIAVQYHCHEILADLINAASATDYSQNEVPYACALSYSSTLERIAMHGNHRESLKKSVSILKESQDLSAAAPNGMTALMQAIDFQDIDVVSALLNAENELAKIPFRDPQDPDSFNLPIHFAAQLGARRDVPEAVRILELIDSINDDMNTKKKPPLDSAGRTPLHLAVTGPSKRASMWILDRRPGLLDIEDQFGRTALHYCYSATNANLLLSKGTDVNHTDTNGRTALHGACLRGELEIVRCLLEHNPLLDLKNNSHGTPLHCAIIRGSLEVASALLEAGAPVNEVDGLRNTPLHVAASLCRHNIVRLLMQYGADIHTEDPQGRTAALIAKSLETYAGIVTYKILLGDEASDDGGLAETLHTRYLETGVDADVLPSYRPEDTPPSSETLHHEPDRAVGTVGPIDPPEHPLARAERGIFNAEAEDEAEAPEPKRRIAEFVYTLATEYGIPLGEARHAIREFAHATEAIEYINLERDKSNTPPGEFSKEMVLGDAGTVLAKARRMVWALHSELVMHRDKLTELYDAVGEIYGISYEVPWHMFSKSVAIVLEVGRPVWDVWELDDAKAAELVSFGRWIDQCAESDRDVAARFDILSFGSYVDHGPPLPMLVPRDKDDEDDEAEDDEHNGDETSTSWEDGWVEVREAEHRIL